MAATLTSILIHYVFSTKHRAETIPVAMRPDLFQYIGGVCRDMKSVLMHAGGMPDHVHLLVSQGKTVSPADLMMHVRRASSIWMKNQATDLATFAWQDGYFGFSIGHDSIDAVRAYFDHQEEHHRKHDFKTEVLAFLEKYHVKYDPEHLWD